jgi:hypothetical protein
MEVIKNTVRKAKIYGEEKQTAENGCEMWLRDTN